MFPTILRQQTLDTRHLDHQIPLNSLDPASFAQFGNGLPSMLPQTFHHQLHSSQSSRTGQHAFPATRPLSLASHDSSNSATPQGFNNTSEHTLRRKTPNGTLTAGYDGTPGDRTMQLHPSKHIIVSSPDPVQSFSSHAGHSNETWKANTYEQLSDGSRHKRFPSAFKYNTATSTMTLAGFPHNNATGGNWASFHYPFGFDSVLNQSATPPVQRFYLQNGQQIPTVLPATIQPVGLGPTASMDTGPYGPYWPNGVYIPYRPAALRDSRFQSSMGWGGNQLPLHTDLGDIHRPLFNASSLPATNYVSFPAIGGSQQDYNKQQGIRDNLMSVDPFQPKFPSRHLGQIADAADMYDQGNALAYQPNPNYVDSGTAMDEMNLDARNWPSGFGQSGYQAPPLDVRGRSGNAEFKEKVLSWAHSIYVDLLATLHSRKNNQRSQADSHSHPSSKPSIYPKPPRQPGSDFSSQHDSISASSSQQFGGSGHANALSQFSKQARDTDRCGRRHSDQDAWLVQNCPMSSHAYQGHYDPYGQYGQVPYHRLNSTDPTERLRLLRRASGSTAARLTPSQQNEMSIKINAKSSLDMLSTLCQESDWQWIDGMLLGGCLAYGLGDYQKAMRWYDRILKKDETHVEAISNLAATLLALNRKEEASHYWLKAVKLRPSYFEAVEHLIGLLCGNHRGKEAVGIIEYVERSLRTPGNGDFFKPEDQFSDTSSSRSRSSSVSTMESIERAVFDYEDSDESMCPVNTEATQAGYGSSGYNIPGAENGRMLALVHAKGNMLYALGDNSGAATAFEDAILIAAGRRRPGIQSLIRRILAAFSGDESHGRGSGSRRRNSTEPILLLPDKALQTSKLVFPHHGNLPGLEHVPTGIAKKAAVSTTSNSLLSLAKIYQDGMSSSTGPTSPKTASGVRDILALYYLSLSLQPSPSTANNVGILLASVQQSVPHRHSVSLADSQVPDIPGVVPGSGIALALAYYNYGLNLDSKHAHLYTNLGSLLKDIGQLPAAIKMYEQAVQCDGHFDIALANLANAVKDQGRISDAINYYRRAVKANPDFAEAVCGLANAQNSVCAWTGRGGVIADNGLRDRWHVDEKGMLSDALSFRSSGLGWMHRVVEIVQKQLRDGEHWGRGALVGAGLENLRQQLAVVNETTSWAAEKRSSLDAALKRWAGHRWEGARIIRLIERATKRLAWLWYQDRYVHHRERNIMRYSRPQLPSALVVPNAPTVLPFHTFTCPLSAKEIRQISQRNALRISCSALRSPWLPSTIYKPPPPPNPQLHVGYVSSDFNNHPLAHLMQSAFGFHNPAKVKAFCYATTASDNSVHRKQIEREAPVFRDASGWSVDRLVDQIVQDGIHILVNLNGYTRGARNEVFAARPAPIHMSFMGFAGTLGAEWCDYILADDRAIPPQTLRPWRRNVDVEDCLVDDSNADDEEGWIYNENIIFARDTFFCCDHRQSAPDAKDRHLSWPEEQENRWKMRKELFPTLADDAIILGNFNQLYKIDPTTFRTWLRILARVPKAILWLLRFPDLGETNLKATALHWAGEEIASRIIFTDVAPKHQHISRARICDLFLDTPECNAHTTAADVLWSGTPLLTLPRYPYKMCSRMASSILTSALPSGEEGMKAREDLIAKGEEDYETKAVALGNDLVYSTSRPGRGKGRLMELRRILFEGRWSNALFDTRRWVRDLEEAYEIAWGKWVRSEGGDIWL